VVDMGIAQGFGDSQFIQLIAKFIGPSFGCIFVATATVFCAVVTSFGFF
jgi:ABC-type thiamine transport system ATPase subunit